MRPPNELVQPISPRRTTARERRQYEQSETKKHRYWDDRDTIRPECDFSWAVRGVTAARYAQGTNIVTVAPDVADVFPNTSAVNEALRALAPLLRDKRAAACRTKPCTRRAEKRRARVKPDVRWHDRTRSESMPIW